MSYKILSLHIYPIKSCAGIELKESAIETTGLKWDRQWMIVDKNGVFLSQRKHPKMAQLKTAFKNSPEGLYLTLEIPGFPEAFEIPTFKESTQTLTVEVWDSVVEASLESDLISKALTEFMGQTCSLVRYGSRAMRINEWEEGGVKSEVRFSDAMPILLVNKKSLDELNQKTNGEVIPGNRFRGNIVIEADQAFEEDNWQHVVINGVHLKSAWTCSRCTVTTVDQDTGKKPSVEPLRALAGFRREGSRVLFGQYVTVEQVGAISINDRVEIKN